MYNEYSIQYNNWCDFYDPDHIEMKTIHKYFSFQDSAVLEIGCGTGRFTIKILEDNPNLLLAIDNDEESIAIAQSNIKNSNVQFRLLDANSMLEEVNNGFFDYVVFSWSLNYIENITKVLGDAIKCCKGGGKIIVLFPVESEYSQMIGMVKKHDYMKCYSNEYIDMIENFFVEQGVHIIEDDIITDFRYCTCEEAVFNNLFHWDSINLPLTNAEIQKFKELLKKYKKPDGQICIQDNVKLIIGGIENVK